MPPTEDALALEAQLGAMNDGERQHFENLLTIRAYVCGWTGDPLCQPIESVAAAYRQMRRERDDKWRAARREKPIDIDISEPGDDDQEG